MVAESGAADPSSVDAASLVASGPGVASRTASPAESTAEVFASAASTSVEPLEPPPLEPPLPPEPPEPASLSAPPELLPLAPDPAPELLAEPELLPLLDDAPLDEPLLDDAPPVDEPELVLAPSPLDPDPVATLASPGPASLSARPLRAALHASAELNVTATEMQRKPSGRFTNSPSYQSRIPRARSRGASYPGSMDHRRPLLATLKDGVATAPRDGGRDCRSFRNTAAWAYCALGQVAGYFSARTIISRAGRRDKCVPADNGNSPARERRRPRSHEVEVALVAGIIVVACAIASFQGQLDALTKAQVPLDCPSESTMQRAGGIHGGPFTRSHGLPASAAAVQVPIMPDALVEHWPLAPHGVFWFATSPQAWPPDDVANQNTPCGAS